MTAPDARAVRILLDAFWGPGGWNGSPVSDEDRRYAVAAGVMFDPMPARAHDEIVAGVCDAYSALDGQQVGQAFLASLSTRRVELRSALGSFVLAAGLSPHTFEPGLHGDARTCAWCGLHEVERGMDVNIMSFERYKWGGVRRDDLVYVEFDLRCLDKVAVPAATAADREILDGILDWLADLPDGTTAAAAARQRWPGLRSNRAERSVVLDILGVCSVLATADHPGYAGGFVRADARPLPPVRFVEQAFPVCWWRAEDGVNRDVLAGLLGF